MHKPEAPTFTPQDAEHVANRHFGLQAKATPLPSYEDQNFLLTAPQGRFVLKIANAATRPADVDLQQAALEFLENHEARCPRLVRSSTGERLIRATSPGGTRHLAWMVSYLEGRMLGKAVPQMPSLLRSLGAYLGALDNHLRDFEHPNLGRYYEWDLRHACDLRRHLPAINDKGRRDLVSEVLSNYESRVLPRLAQLRTSAIHNDANDYNVVVDGFGYDAHVSGIIDFGDMVETHVICEVAIASTYVMLNKPDPVGAAAAVVEGYHTTYPLEEQELEVLFDLIQARLCTSVLHSAARKTVEPENAYLQLTEAPAWALLEQLTRTSRPLAHFRFRHACGMAPCPNGQKATKWLQNNGSRCAPVVVPDVRTAPVQVVDLSVTNPAMGLPMKDVHSASRALFARLKRSGAAVGIGRYNEPRLVYGGDSYEHPNNEYAERRTIHLGIDLFQEAGSPIFVPLDGEVVSLNQDPEAYGFGGTVVLRHDADGVIFYTLYGHLSHDSVDRLRLGQKVVRGERFADLGAPEENGVWIPHLHFQVLGDLLDGEAAVTGVAPASQRAVWLSVCPDPNLLLGIPEECFPAPAWEKDKITLRREAYIGGNLSISYRRPLHIVRGLRQYLYDATGRAYLDAVNNVPHVGHCHPAVVRAAQRQQRILNTNTRYLHRTLVEYAERLAAKMPDPLEVCFFVNSGSEANDLALRLAHAFTQANGIVVLDGAYHGHLGTLIGISPYKFDGPGGEGAPSHVQVALTPDPYRGPFRGEEAAARYASSVRDAIKRLKQPLSAFICESLLGCGGQIEFPPGYLSRVYAHVRSAGGLCIADEVQVGFGRVGSHYWGFETQGVVPDIVVLGKPMGNGHPIAGVVTTRAIAEAFDNGMEFFSTFGGNPVSCAVGMAVMDVIEREGLQQHALEVGGYLRQRLTDLMDTHEVVGDVRGRGLFLGVELVTDWEARTPAGEEASYVANRMSERGVLVSTDGPFGNVLKIKPPLVFSQTDADQLVDALASVLEEDFVLRGLTSPV